jgi:DNA modification methylase
MDEKSVQCVVTSPPYYNLRDYQIDGQIGREKTPAEYVAKIVEVFRAIRRVLRDDGVAWLIIDDTYANDTKWGGRTGGLHAGKLHGATGIGRGKVSTGLKPKELIGIPWRVAFALQDDGWYLRQDDIWNKPNTMPESVRDRFTRAHEYVFLLSKSARYYFDVEAVKEPASGSDAKRRKRSVLTVPVRAFKGSHFATFPTTLIEPLVLAGSPPSCCATCRAPRVGKFERTPVVDPTYRGSTFTEGKTGARDGGDRTQKGPRYLTRFIGYEPSCKCGAPDAPALVFDPFGGSGTTAVVALKHGRSAALCEINPEYVEMAHRRIASGK